MTHRVNNLPALRDRLIAAWGGRARIRRNLAIAISDSLMLTIAFQTAFPEVGLERSAVFSTVTRVLTGLGVWLTSRAVLRITGEIPRNSDLEGDQ